MEKQKIFEEYFRKNKSFEQEIAETVTEIVNEVLNDLPDGSPMKSREKGLEIMATVRKMLEDAL